MKQHCRRCCRHHQCNKVSCLSERVQVTFILAIEWKEKNPGVALQNLQHYKASCMYVFIDQAYIYCQQMAIVSIWTWKRTVASLNRYYEHILQCLSLVTNINDNFHTFHQNFLMDYSQIGCPNSELPVLTTFGLLVFFACGTTPWAFVFWAYCLCQSRFLFQVLFFLRIKVVGCMLVHGRY